MRRILAELAPILAGLIIGATIITALTQLHQNGCC